MKARGAAEDDHCADMERRVADYLASSEGQFELRRLIASSTVRLLERLAKRAPDAVAEAAALWLEEACAGSPALSTFSADLRRDAAWWADCASPPELEAYVAAGLRRMGVTIFAEAPRERILVEIWQGMPEARRRAFLSRVDPRGVLRGRAA